MADKIVKQIKVEETIYDIGGSLYKLDEGNFEKKSLVLNEGEASGISSIAGGTINKKLVTDIVGETVDDYIDIEPSKANASMTIAYGAGNVANASASNAFGIKNQAGVKGYYIWDIDFSTKTITLSTNQRKSRLPIIGTSRKSPNSSILSGWKTGDYISSLSATIQSVNPSNGTIVVDNIPYTEIDWPTVWLPTDMSIVAIPQVKTQTYLGQTFETYRPETVGEVEFGFSSTAFGFDNITSGTLSTAFGMRNTATGTTSFVTGRENMGGFASLVGGYQNTCSGSAATATGKGNLVTGYAASAHGQNLVVLGDGAHGEGHATTIFVPKSIDTSNVKNIFADWNGKEATEKYSVAFGNYSHVEGQNNIALGHRAHAEGWMTAAEGWASHAEGKNTYAVGYESHAEGLGTKTEGEGAHAEGNTTVASGNYSHAEGEKTEANSYGSHAEGEKSKTEGKFAHAEGGSTKAYGDYSHAEGHQTVAKGKESHAEGESSKECPDSLVKVDENGNAPAAINLYNDWSGKGAGDKYCVAFGDYSHVEGQNSIAFGSRSHAQGWNAVAGGIASSATGRDTKAGYVSGEKFDLYDDSCPYQNKSPEINTKYPCIPGNLYISGEVDWYDVEGTGELVVRAYNHNLKSLSNTTVPVSVVSSESQDEGGAIHFLGTVDATISLPQETAFIAFISPQMTLGFYVMELTTTASSSSYAVTSGYNNSALGQSSSAHGKGTVAQGHSQVVTGEYNSIDYNNQYAQIVGNGTSTSKRSNAYTLGWNGNGAYYGNLHTAKDLTVGGSVSITKGLSAESMLVDTDLTVYDSIHSGDISADGGIFAYDNIVSMSGVHADFGDVVAQAAQIPENGYEKDESISLIQTNSDAKEAKSLAEENKARLDASVRNGVYTFGSYLNAIPDQEKQYGYLIKLYNEGTGSTKKNAYFTIKITGFSDGSGSDGNMPFDSTYQFYCYPSYNNNAGIVTKRSGVAFGKDFGELLVYRNEKDFYAFLPITANNLILNFEIISNKADLNPTITFGEKHETRQLEYSIATKYRLRNGSGAYAELVNNAAIAAGSSSHAEGNNTAAIGTNAHAEGGAEIITVSITGSAGATEYTLSSSNDKIRVNQVVKCGSAYAYITKYESNKITVNTTLSSSALTSKQATIYTSAAFGSNSHSEGYSTIALGKGSHSEGHETNATGDQSHSEGLYTNAKGKATHAEGYGTVACSKFDDKNSIYRYGQHVEGTYNLEDTNANFIHITGIGTNSKRDNGFTVDRSGNGWFKGNITIGGTLKDGVYTGGKTVATQDYVTDAIANFTTKEYVDNAIKGIQIPEAPDLSGYATHQEVQEAVKDLASQGYVDNAISSIKIPEIPEFTWEGLPGTIPTNKLPSEATFDKLFIKTKILFEENGVIDCYNILTKNIDVTGHGSFDDGISVLEGDIYISAVGNGDIYIERLDEENISLTTAYFLAKRNQERLNTIPIGLAVGSADGAEIFNDSRNEANGIYSHAEGEKTKAFGEAAHAENYLTRAYGDFSHAEGWRVVALGDKSHAEGSSPRPFDHNDYTEQLTKGTDPRDYTSQEIFNIWNERPADARFTMSIGNWSHAEGQGCLSIGTRSHAEGWNTAACSVGAHTEGIGTISAWFTSVDPWDKAVNAQHVEGSYNEILDFNYLHIVGNGRGDDERSNAHTLDVHGNAWYAGNIQAKALVCAENYGYGPDLPDESTAVKGQIFFKIPSEE